jgi:hypothetical protein
MSELKLQQDITQSLRGASQLCNPHPKFLSLRATVYTHLVRNPITPEIPPVSFFRSHSINAPFFKGAVFLQKGLDSPPF